MQTAKLVGPSYRFTHNNSSSIPIPSPASPVASGDPPTPSSTIHSRRKPTRKHKKPTTQVDPMQEKIEALSGVLPFVFEPPQQSQQAPAPNKSAVGVTGMLFHLNICQ